ncbi:hypothetical protein M404DRAFT_160733, partial [Pisolithus tinctorius Marx 270]
GPFFIGLTVNIFLYGVLTTQVYLYFTAYKKDRPWLKMLVVILYIADTFNCIISIYYIYDALVSHFGAPSFLTVRVHFLCSGPRDNLRKGTIGAVVQHFFAWRVYMMTKKVFIVLAIILCSLVNLAGSLGATIRVAVNPNLSELPRLAVEVTMWLVGAVLADMIIAVSLVWHLRRYKHFYPALASIINRILRMTVQTGVLTTIVAIIDLACYLTINSGIHLIFNIPLSKLYTNCMLSSLNARRARKYDGSLEQELSCGGVNTHQVSALARAISSRRLSYFP